MSSGKPRSDIKVRYEPDDGPHLPVALGLGAQYAILIVARIVVVPLVLVRAAGIEDGYLSWALFAAISLCGLTTMLQALRFGRIGSGYVAVMGTSLAVVGVGVTALAEGGPALLATLVLAASVVPLAMSARLAIFRRILNPTVSGTVIMLIPATLMPKAFDLITEVPAGVPMMAAPICASVTLLVIFIIALAGGAAWRLWSPVIGVVAGTAAAAIFGLFDLGDLGEAFWVGIPTVGWPGLDLSFGPLFWGLLPGFLLVSLIESVQTISNAVAVQRVSWRRHRAVDFRAVQGAVATAGVGNMLCGVAGTVPNTFLSTSVAVTELTGAAARRVGIAAGAVLIAMALMPKALAFVLAIPGPVVAAYLVVLMATLFILGMKMVLHDGLDHRKGLIVGVAFWIGAGFQYGALFPDFASGFAGGMLRSGVTSGGLAVILLTVLMEAMRPRQSRIEMVLDVSALPALADFLNSFAHRNGWSEAVALRLNAVAEETLLTLADQDRAGLEGGGRRLVLKARKENGAAALEFTAVAGEGNLQDRMALIGEDATWEAADREVSLRILRHLSSSVRHEQYHDTDIVTVRVAV